MLYYYPRLFYPLRTISDDELLVLLLLLDDVVDVYHFDYFNIILNLQSIVEQLMQHYIHRRIV